jgi:crooked neck
VFERANKALRSADEKEARLMLLEAWQEFETQFGSEKSRSEVKGQLPKKVKRRRKIQTEDGSDAGWEEYYDYIFPSDAAAHPHLKFLERARLWKQQAEAAQNPEPDPDSEGAASGSTASEKGPSQEEDDVDSTSSEDSDDDDRPEEGPKRPPQDKGSDSGSPAQAETETREEEAEGPPLPAPAPGPGAEVRDQNADNADTVRDGD